MTKGPWRITFDTNPDTCNLNCIMCEEHSPYNEQIQVKKKHRLMSVDTIKEVITKAVPMGLKEIIPSTMGEPLLYKDFDIFIELSNKYDLKLNLTTNGTFPGKSIEAWSKLLIPVCSDIKISFNGSVPTIHEQIMIGSNFQKTLGKIKHLLNERDRYHKETGNYCSITIQSTFMENNVEDLNSLALLCIELGVDRLKGHHLWTHYNEMEALSMKRNSSAIEHWNHVVGKVQKTVETNFLPNGNRLKLQNITPINLLKSSADKTGYCPFLNKEAWINWEGRFDPCCAPDNLRKSLGQFGNVNKSSFTDIWNSQSYQDLAGNYHEENLCKNCNMKTCN